MENTIFNGQQAASTTPPAYDYRAYDQVWQRVTPGVDPYAEDAINPNPSPAVQSVQPIQSVQSVQSVQPAPRQEGGAATLPGADPNPCCMGTNAQDSVEVLEGFIQEEQAAARCCQSLGCHVRNQTAAQLFRRFASEKQAAAREMCGAYYLITGSRYSSSITVEHMHWASLAEALRSCYHQEACSGLNYARAAEETLDRCLTELFNKLSEQAYQRAEDVMTLLGKLIC